MVKKNPPPQSEREREGERAAICQRLPLRELRSEQLRYVQSRGPSPRTHGLCRAFIQPLCVFKTEEESQPVLGLAEQNVFLPQHCFSYYPESHIIIVRAIIYVNNIA